MALDKIKKHLIYSICCNINVSVLQYKLCACVCLCVLVCLCATVNKIKVIQTDFSLQTQNWGLLCPLTPLPLFFFFFSCQCQRSGSVNGPDGCRTQSPLSPFIPPSFPELLQTTVLFKPPPLLHLSTSSHTPLSLSLSLSWRCGRGCTSLGRPGLCCCQGFPKLGFPSLTAVYLWHCLAEKWKQPIPDDFCAPMVLMRFFLLLLIRYLIVYTDGYKSSTILKRKRIMKEGLPVSRNQQTSLVILPEKSAITIICGGVYTNSKLCSLTPYSQPWCALSRKRSAQVLFTDSCSEAEVSLVPARDSNHS